MEYRRIWYKLQKAIKHNDTTKVKHYLSLGACEEYINKGFDGYDNGHLLAIATHKNNYEIIKLLLDHGADPNIMDSHDEYTPLMVSLHHKDINMDIVKLLIERSDVDVTSDGDSNALSIATLNNLKEVIVMLLDKHAYYDEYFIADHLYYDDNSYNIFYDYYIQKLRHIIALQIIKKFLLKKVILKPDSKYIRRLVNSFEFDTK
jgi:ankyrin repeat protein